MLFAAKQILVDVGAFAYGFILQQFGDVGIEDGAVVWRCVVKFIKSPPFKTRHALGGVEQSRNPVDDRVKVVFKFGY